jgi:hypothetical protein
LGKKKEQFDWLENQINRLGPSNHTKLAGLGLGFVLGAWVCVGGGVLKAPLLPRSFLDMAACARVWWWRW